MFWNVAIARDEISLWN